jgi:PST family polysaccharide transporter
MTLRKKAIHGAKWSMAQEIIGQSLDFFTIIILARLLDPKDFGVIAIAMVIISSMKPFVSQGLGVAITQKDKLEKEHLDTAFWATFVMGCIFALFLATTAGWWASFFSESELKSILIWFSASIVLMSLTTVQEAILRRELNFKVYAIRASTGKLIGGAVGITLAFYGFGIWSLVARYLVTSLVSVFLLWKISNWYPSFSFSKRHFGELFPFGIQVMMNNLLVFVNRNSDSLLISYFLGSTALGYYNIAYKLMSLTFQLVSKTVSQVGMPAFARLQNDKKRLWKAFFDITQLIALIVFPVFLGMLVLVPEIVTSLLGEKWIPSIPVLQILLLIGIVQCLLGPIISILIGTGKAMTRLKLQMVDSIVNLIGFSIAVHWGIVWVAASYVIVGYLLTPLWFWAITKVVNVRWIAYIKLILRPLIVTIVMMIVIVEARPAFIDIVEGINFIILSVIVGGVIYSFMIYFLYPTAVNKIMNILKTLFTKKRKHT